MVWQDILEIQSARLNQWQISFSTVPHIAIKIQTKRQHSN